MPPSPPSSFPEVFATQQGSTSWFQCEGGMESMVLLWKAWWGSKDQYIPPGRNTVLSICQGSMTPQDTVRVCRYLSLLKASKGRMLVRDAYKIIFERLQNISQEDAVRGVAISGQPGIGKSVFSVFVLLSCLSRSWPVAFSTARGKTFVFDSTGVRVQDTSYIKDVDAFESIQLPSGLSRIWALADSPLGKEQSLPHWFTDDSELFFYTVFTPPTPLIHDTLFFKDGAREWLMPLWSAEEIEALITEKDMFKLTSIAKNALNAADASEVARHFHAILGGSVREFPEFMTNPDLFIGIMKDVLESLIPSALGILINDPFSAKNFELSHKLFVVDRADPLDSDPRLGENDNKIILLKGGQEIRDYLAYCFSRHSLEDTARLFNACHNPDSLGNSVTNVIAGYAFEALAMRFLAIGAGTDPTFGLFTFMHRVANQRYQFEYTSSQAAVRTPPFNNALSRRVIKRYQGSKLTGAFAEADYERIYVPQASNNPLFDAFFYHSTSSTLQLYILHATVSTTHGGVAKGFEIVDHLVKRARDGGEPSVEVKYILVVPATLSSKTITWNMASEYSNVEGDVYIQFLRIGQLY